MEVEWRKWDENQDPTGEHPGEDAYPLPRLVASGERSALRLVSVRSGMRGNSSEVKISLRSQRL